MTFKKNRPNDEEFLKKIFSDEEDEIFQALDELDVEEMEWKEHNPINTTGQLIVSNEIFSVSTEDKFSPPKHFTLKSRVSENVLQEVKERSIDNYLFA